MFCNKLCKNKNSHINHQRLCKQNPDRPTIKTKFHDVEWQKSRKGANQYTKAKILGLPKPELSEKQKKILNWTGRHHSEESKLKISNGRKKFLEENPDQVPYLLNHSSKESYPEKYFKEILNNNNINYIQEYRIGLYSIDFAIIDKNIALEIDGNQHYYDQKIVDSDKKRDIVLLDLGWETIRVNWCNYKKFEYNDRKIYINNLLELLV